jgi:hypothetical protein
VESSSPSHFSQGELEKIFSFESPSSVRLNSRENGRLEFKEQFNLGSVDEYAKTGAAFANAQGGYIVFGVKDAPRELVGLKSEHFNTFDSAKLTNALNERFSPEIRWEPHTHLVRNLKVGILYFAEATQKPVVCTKNSGCLHQGAIYYRYRGRSEAIRYAELRRLLDDDKAKERNLWMKQIRKIAEVGVENAAILDLESGEVSGGKGRFYIGEELLPKLQFIREGEFVESDGAMALRLLGDLQSTEGLFVHSTVEVPVPIREAQIISAFLRRQSVLSPTEYLKAICFEQSYYHPVYYFILQTTETIDGIVPLLEGLEVRGNVRDKLIERLRHPNERLAIGSLTSSNPTAVERRAIVAQLRTKSLTPETILAGTTRFFEALTHTDSVDFDQTYLFALLADLILPKLSQLEQLERSAFRKALCHLDLTWYKAALS